MRVTWEGASWADAEQWRHLAWDKNLIPLPVNIVHSSFSFLDGYDFYSDRSTSKTVPEGLPKLGVSCPGAWKAARPSASTPSHAKTMVASSVRSYLQDRRVVQLSRIPPGISSPLSVCSALNAHTLKWTEILAVEGGQVISNVNF